MGGVVSGGVSSFGVSAAGRSGVIGDDQEGKETFLLGLRRR